MNLFFPDKWSRETTLVGTQGQSLPQRRLEAEPIHEKGEARAYARMMHTHYRLLSKHFVDILSKVPLQKGRILDIGSGPGWIPIEIAQRKPGWEIWGVDPSTDMLAMATEHARKKGVSARVRFMAGNALQLPFPNAHFDLVISHFVLHHLEQPEAMFNEAARVTRGGGRILIKDLRRPPRWKATLLLWISRTFLKYSKEQEELYRDSLRAALSISEVQEALARSQLCMGGVKGSRGHDLLVYG